MRFMLLTILNLSLPFMLRAIYLLALQVIRKRQQKRQIIDVTPVTWHFPVIKLLLIGFALLACTLFAWRLGFVELDTSFHGNEAVTESY